MELRTPQNISLCAPRAPAVFCSSTPPRLPGPHTYAPACVDPMSPNDKPTAVIPTSSLRIRRPLRFKLPVQRYETIGDPAGKLCRLLHDRHLHLRTDGKGRSQLRAQRPPRTEHHHSGRRLGNPHLRGEIPVPDVPECVHVERFAMSRVES